MLILTTIAIATSVFVISSVKNSNVTSKWKASAIEAYIEERGSIYKNPQFFLVVPALREQKVIIRIIDRLLSMNYDPANYEIIIALDRKERENEQETPSTFDVAEKHLSQLGIAYPKITICEFDGIAQSRAHQINNAVAHIASSIANNYPREDAFVGLYDADSLPDTNVLNYISWRLMKDSEIRAFQQVLDYRLNTNAMKRSRLSSLFIANAYYQTAWNSIFEIPRFLHNNKTLSNGKPSTFPPYCMGHGEFIRFDTLMDMGGVATNGSADGIQLGFALTNKRIKIEPIPLPDLCESPSDILTLIHQHSLWFCGNLQVFKYIVSSSESIGIKIIQAVNHLLLNLKWLFRGVIFFVIISLMTKAFFPIENLPLASILLAVFISQLYIYRYCSFGTVYKDISAEVSYPPCNFGWVLCSIALKSVGPWIALFKIIVSYFFSNPLTFRKVERV